MLFGLILIIVVCVFVLRSDILKIKSINITLDKVSCASPDQIKVTSRLFGQNIFFLNQEKVKESIKNKFVCVKDLVSTRRLPNTIDLLVKGRTPAAILKLNEATLSGVLEDIATPSAKPGNGFLVDNEGVVFDTDSGQDNIPTIFILEKPENIAASNLQILQKMTEFGLNPKQAVVSQNWLIVFSTPKIIFRTDSRVDIQLASLQLILEKAKIEDVRLEFVDLRFDKPTVRFAPKNKLPK